MLADKSRGKVIVPYVKQELIKNHIIRNCKTKRDKGMELLGIQDGDRWRGIRLPTKHHNVTEKVDKVL